MAQITDCMRGAFQWVKAITKEFEAIKIKMIGVLIYDHQTLTGCLKSCPLLHIHVSKESEVKRDTRQHVLVRNQVRLVRGGQHMMLNSTIVHAL